VGDLVDLAHAAFADSADHAVATTDERSLEGGERIAGYRCALVVSALSLVLSLVSSVRGS